MDKPHKGEIYASSEVLPNSIPQLYKTEGLKDED